MRIKLMVLVISLFSVLSFSQTKEIDYESGIKKEFTTFFESIKDKNIENAVNFIYPKYLNLIGREQMIKMLTLSYNNPAFIIDIQNFKMDNIEAPELIEGEYFSITNYSFKMQFKVDWKVIHNPELVKEKINGALVSKYGKENVVNFNNGDYYMIDAHMKACAVSKDEKKWKFLILEENYKPVLKGILPQKILDKF